MGESVSLGSTRKESIPLDLQNLQGGLPSRNSSIVSQSSFVCAERMPRFFLLWKSY